MAHGPLVKNVLMLFFLFHLKATTEIQTISTTAADKINIWYVHTLNIFQRSYNYEKSVRAFAQHADGCLFESQPRQT